MIRACHFSFAYLQQMHCNPFKFSAIQRYFRKKSVVMSLNGRFHLKRAGTRSHRKGVWKVTTHPYVPSQEGMVDDASGRSPPRRGDGRPARRGGCVPRRGMLPLRCMFHPACTGSCTKSLGGDLMADMGRYCKAYSLKRLREFKDWTENVHYTRQEKQH
jgi:hypothetical protein